MPDAWLLVTIDLTIEPAVGQWPALLASEPGGDLLGHPVATWRAKTRREVGLDAERPIIATGHQTLLWHPGILVKYLLVDRLARAHQWATANLIVDQHTGDAENFGAFDVPIRRANGLLGVRTLQMTTVRPEVPMGLHEPFTPPRPPEHLPVALPSVQEGLDRIFDSVYAHRAAPNAALQMAGALADLMRPWVSPMAQVTSCELVETSLARALLARMVEDPSRCAACYNRAVAAVPEAGIGPLMVRDDYVELPLWRIRPDGRRMRAYDHDVERWLEDRHEAAPLLPRALFMTALIRLGMCDLFVHGTGGARYDRAMELWLDEWLSARPAPIAVASATLRLPLDVDGAARIDLADAQRALRRVEHDPESAIEARGPSPRKRALIEAIEAAPRGSGKRRERFFQLHRRLTDLRAEHADRIEEARQRVETATAQAASRAIIERRTWPFPLYPASMIDALAEAVAGRVAEQGSPAGEG